MTWAFVGFAVIALAIISTVAFLMLSSISQTLSNALSTLERVHTNDGKRIDQVLDRLMAMDFESFKSYQLAEDSDVGGIEEPEEPYVQLERPSGLPFDLSAAAAERLANEERIISEDFPAEEEVVA